MAEAHLNKTDSRVAALREVMARDVVYDDRTGGFEVSGQALSGARRRTFAELRSAGIVTAGHDSVVRLVSPKGVRLAAEWGLTSQASAG